MSIFLAITVSAKGLNIADIIRPIERQRYNVVFGKLLFLSALSTSIMIKLFQNIPIAFRMSAFRTFFTRISSGFKMGNIRLMASTIITMVNLFTIANLSDTAITRLLIERHQFFPKVGITSLRAEVSLFSSKCRYFGLKGFTAIITRSKEVGTVCFTYLSSGYKACNVSLLESLYPFSHNYIISQKVIYENGDLLK